VKVIEVDRLMDRASEAAVLGSMMQDHQVIPSVLEFVTEASFFLDEHRTIFAAIKTVWRRNPGGAVDGVLLRSELESAKELADIGGLDYLRRVVEATPTAANAVYYAQQVAKKQRFRELVATTEKMQSVLADGGDVDAQVAEVQRLAMSLDCQRAEQNVYDVAKHATQIALDTQNGSTAMPTGFRNLDDLIVGFEPGGLTVPAARPSMGKTSFACGLTLNMARSGRRILFFTLEMSARLLVERLIAMLGGVSLKVIKSGNPPKDVLDAFYQASLDLEKLPITIIENATTPERLGGMIHAMKQAGPVDVVIVDYLGLMESGQRTNTRNDEVTVISRQLKHLAQRHEVAVIALSQLNRACEARTNHRPHLSDLRDSGSIEQDADIVMFLHREDYFRKLKDPTTAKLDGLAEIIVAKNRNGPTGVAKMTFIEEQMRFFDYSNWTE
jgi:replicative DNA helicase